MQSQEPKGLRRLSTDGCSENTHLRRFCCPPPFWVRCPGPPQLHLAVCRKLDGFICGGSLLATGLVVRKNGSTAASLNDFIASHTP